MNFKEFLNNIKESTEFNELDKRRLGKHAAAVADSNKIAGRDTASYIDDQRYNDYQGIKWLNVRKKDDYTLKSAIIDGINDVETEYEDDLDAAEDMKKAYQNIKYEDELDEFGIPHESLVNEIMNFLRKHMHGKTTVYRGYCLPKKIVDELYSNNNIKYKNELLRYINNKTKVFNSFSISPKIAMDFANDATFIKAGDNRDFYPLIIAAEVEPNDINWAFTAYLMGRHGGVNEFELNINNLKDLINLRIIENPQQAVERYYSTLPDIKELQKKLDSGMKITDVFDTTYKFYNKKQDYNTVLADYGNAVVLIRNNKILTPFSDVIFEVKENIFALKLLTNGRWVLYKAGQGVITQSYLYIPSMLEYTNSKSIRVEVEKNKWQLVDIETGKELLPNQVSGICPLTSFGGDTYPLYELILKKHELYTVVNDSGKSIFLTKGTVLKSIDIDTKTKIMTGELVSTGRIVKYILKNGKAIELV